MIRSSVVRLSLGRNFGSIAVPSLSYGPTVTIAPKPHGVDAVVHLLDQDQAQSKFVPAACTKDQLGGAGRFDACVPEDETLTFVGGLGKPDDDVDEDAVRGAVSKAVGALNTTLTSLHVDAGSVDAEPVDVARAAVQAARLTPGSFDRYITEETAPKAGPIGSVTIAMEGGDDVEAAVATMNAMCDGTMFARQLANERGDVACAQYLEDAARSIADAYGMDIVVNDSPEFRLLHAVGQSSAGNPDRAARLVALEHKGDPSNPDEKVMVVGKGITFDTGGLNLKPTGFMEDMHMDMGGSAATLGAALITGKLNIPKNVVFLVALAENSIGPDAYKPHAIIESYKGVTVQVGNTDAEGRLALADALAWGCEQWEPKAVVDLATLTGACVVALGEYSSGVFSNDDDLASKLISAGSSVGETAWRLPILKGHREEMKGAPFADYNSTGPSRYGGACTAAAFLEIFVPKDTPWAHIDIAGPAMVSKTRGHILQGGTGYGAALIAEWLREA